MKILKAKLEIRFDKNISKLEMQNKIEILIYNISSANLENYKEIDFLEVKNENLLRSTFDIVFDEEFIDVLKIEHSIITHFKKSLNNEKGIKEVNLIIRSY